MPADTVSFRLDGDIASPAKANAAQAGLPMSEYLNEVLRGALAKGSGMAPQYVPIGRRGEWADAQFAALKGSNQQRVWVFRDLLQRPVVWLLPADLEHFGDFGVTLRPRGGRALAVPRDDLIAWESFGNDHERNLVMYAWIHTGASPHPWNPYRIE